MRGDWSASLPAAWRVDPEAWAARRGWGRVPCGVLRPPDGEAVAEIFRAAQRHPAPPASVVVSGGGSQLARQIAARPTPGPGDGSPLWVVDVSAVSGEVEFSPGNLTLQLPAGISWEDVAALLAERGDGRLVYPIEGPGGSSSTVGGHLAANTAGPCSYRYGTARDWALGAEFVAADGRRVRFGRPVMKNVAGYDLTRLLIGSRGALGALVQVILRLRPAPPLRRTARLLAPGLAELWPVIRQLKESPGGPVAMEACSLWGTSSDEIAWNAGSSRSDRAARQAASPDPSAHLLAPRAPALAALFEYHGPDDELQEEERRLASLVAGRAELVWAETGEEERWWSAWRALRSGLAFAGGEGALPTVARLGVAPGRMPELWQGGQAILADGPACLAMASPGMGMLRLLGPPPGAERWRKLRELAEKLGGYATWEVAPAEGGYEPTPDPAEELSRALVRVFDPAGVMRPGP